MRLFLLFIFSVAVFSPENSDAQTTDLSAPHRPKLCISVGRVVRDLTKNRVQCEQHHAIYGLIPSEKGQPAQIDCCPLPSTDIVTQEKVIAVGECPENFIVTGGGFLSKECISSQTCELQCTKINDYRYQLGTNSPGAYWGFHDGHAPRQMTFMRSDIPAGIRYGLGRRKRRLWSSEGCVGAPFGALLTAKDGTQCKDLSFRELQYRGLIEDPAEGTPVTMYPPCTAISDVLHPSPRCIR